MQSPKGKKDQVECFKKLARELGADEDEERFNERLKRIAKAKPKPKSKERRKDQQDGGKGQ